MSKPKQVIILIFIPLIFLLFISRANISDFFLSLLPFLILEIKNNCVQSHYKDKDSTACRPLNKVEPCFAGFVPGWVTENEYPCVVITSFFSFPFEGDIKDCRTPQPCVMSLLFLNLFLILPCLHSRVHLQYRTIVQINS